MVVKVFNKTKLFKPKEKVSYITNSQGYLELVRTAIPEVADPKRIAKDFIKHHKIRGNITSYNDGVEIDCTSDTTDFINKLEANGFQFEVEGIDIGDFASELGISEQELIAKANKTLPWAQRLKHRSVIDRLTADGLKEAFRTRLR